jgi:hypothetical protein
MVTAQESKPQAAARFADRVREIESRRKWSLWRPN